MNDGDDGAPGRTRPAGDDDGGDSTTTDRRDGGGQPPGIDGADRERIADRIHEYAATVERTEREAAVRKLEARGGLTDAQREALEAMCDGIVDGLLATPETALREADDRTLRAAMRVYGLDPEAVADEG